MKLGDLIKYERERKKWTQQNLANMVHVSRTTITKYETGKQEVPYDMLLKIIEALDSPRLRLEVFGGVVPCLYLDKVDLSPLAVQMKAIEEMEEAISELKHLNLINKRRSNDLSIQEKENILSRTMVQLHDVNICIDLFLLTLAETFSISLEKLETMVWKKMQGKGYMSYRMEKRMIAG